MNLSWIEMFNRFSTATQMFYWLIDWLIDSFVRSFIHSFIHSLILIPSFVFFVIWYQRKAEAAHFPGLDTMHQPIHVQHSLAPTQITHHIRRQRKLRMNLVLACCLLNEGLMMKTSTLMTVHNTRTEWSSFLVNIESTSSKFVCCLDCTLKQN